MALKTPHTLYTVGKYMMMMMMISVTISEI